MSTSGDFDGEINNSAGGISFWDLKQYSRTVKRLENGNKLCTDLCNMIQDRVEIEKSYSANLHKWSAKWHIYLDSGAEYGTTKQCWLGFCREAEEISEIHKEIKDRLIDETQAEVRNWQKEHFHKATLPPQHIKEAKSLENDFELAQKSWAKKLKKLNQNRRDYHQQFKMSRSYEVQSRNAANDSAISQEQLKKMEDKFRKSEKDCEKLKQLYESSVSEINSDAPRYVMEMTKVFEKSQDMEKERMDFFKGIFERIHKIINLTDNRKLNETYANFLASINALNSEHDATFWSQIYGAEMPFNPPQFEEYSQDLQQSIVTKKKFTLSSIAGGSVGGSSGGGISDPGGAANPVTLTSITPTSRQGSLRSTSYDTPAAAVTPSSPVPGTVFESRGVDLGGTSTTAEAGTEVASLPTTPGMAEDNSCRSENGEEEANPPECVTVRALYDYTGLEEDELNLKEGDIFYKIEDEDDQGWCRGKKNGRVGLYPANYAVPI